MSRVIKFRKWEKDLKIMYYGDNVGVWDSDMPLNRQFEEYRKSEYYELMQFTGLLDKSGKEIYEGDIVRHPYVNGLSTVTYGNKAYNAACFVPSGASSDHWLRERPMDEPWEIVGNIYEHPELLKKEDQQ